MADSFLLGIHLLVKCKHFSIRLLAVPSFSFKVAGAVLLLGAFSMIAELTEIVGLQSTALKNVLVSGWFFLRKVPTSKSSVFAEAMNEASKLKGVN